MWSPKCRASAVPCWVGVLTRFLQPCAWNGNVAHVGSWTFSNGGIKARVVRVPPHPKPTHYNDGPSYFVSQFDVPRGTRYCGFVRFEFFVSRCGSSSAPQKQRDQHEESQSGPNNLVPKANATHSTDRWWEKMPDAGIRNGVLTRNKKSLAEKASERDDVVCCSRQNATKSFATTKVTSSMAQMNATPLSAETSATLDPTTINTSR